MLIYHARKQTITFNQSKTMGRYNPVCILNHQGQLVSNGIKLDNVRRRVLNFFSVRIIPKSELVGHFGEGSLRITTFWGNSQPVANGRLIKFANTLMVQESGGNGF